jgi:hypothetical protein
MAIAQTKYLMDETSNRGHLVEGIRDASFSLSMKGGPLLPLGEAVSGC